MSPTFAKSEECLDHRFHWHPRNAPVNATHCGPLLGRIEMFAWILFMVGGFTNYSSLCSFLTPFLIIRMWARRLSDWQFVWENSICLSPTFWSTGVPQVNQILLSIIKMRREEKMVWTNYNLHLFSASISIPTGSSELGLISPICVVSTTEILTSGGWEDMSNVTKDYKQPFQLYSEKDKTYLQVREKLSDIMNMIINWKLCNIWPKYTL